MPSIEHIDSVERGPESITSQMTETESATLRERFDRLSKTARAVSSFFVLATAAGCASQEGFTPHYEEYDLSERATKSTLVETKQAPVKYSPEWYADSAPLQTGESFDIERSFNSEGKPVDEQYSIVVVGPEEKVTFGIGDNQRTDSRWECQITDKKTGKSHIFMALSRKSAEASGPLYLEPLSDAIKADIAVEKAYIASGMTAPDGDPTGVLKAERRHFEGYGIVVDSLVAVDENDKAVQLMEATIKYGDGKEFTSRYASSIEEVKRRALERLEVKKKL